MHPYFWAQLIKFLARKIERQIPKSLGGLQENEEDYSVWTRNAIIALLKWRDLLISKVFGENVMVEDADIEKLRKLVQGFKTELDKGIEELREMAPPSGWGRFRTYLLKAFESWKWCAGNLDRYLCGLENGWEEERINGSRNWAIKACNIGDEWLSKAISDKANFFSQN